MRHHLLLAIVVSSTIACTDLVDFCDSLQPMCMGSILQYHLTQLSAVANQIANSSIPSLESSLPLIRSNLGSSSPGENSEEVAASTTEKTVEKKKSIEEQVKAALPALTESLPLIRESLPLIRESLPLIREFLDPKYFGEDRSACQRKATCKSCRECPKLREAMSSFVEALCPSTCKLCDAGLSARENAMDLVDIFV